MIVTTSKRYFSIMVSQLRMGEFFRLLWRNVNADRKDRKCFKKFQTNGLSVKENPNAWKMIYTWLCYSEGIYLMRTVTDFNIVR